MSLAELVIDAARRHPESPAVVDAEGRLSYAELDNKANQLAQALQAGGIGKGDRVAIWLDKSGLAVAAMQAVLRLGAVYVPIDPLSPATRTDVILHDCQPSSLLTDASRRQLLRNPPPSLLLPEGLITAEDKAPPFYRTVTLDDPAYILYTSGSTSRPKGVCISHGNALAFVNWCVKTLEPVAEDRFANHAPFHFDLSVFDLYVAFACGARVVLIPDTHAYAPGALVELMLKERISVWYSVPTALEQMMESGGLLSISSPPRYFIFAGEPFPIRHLRSLFERFRAQARFFNFYGPTETNVCTAHEVKEIEVGRKDPVPIGMASSGDRVWAEKQAGIPAEVGEYGELLVVGPSVMLGYWGKPPQGNVAYRTGDKVLVLADGAFLYQGRLDFTVKIRGFRVGLEEVEAAIGLHPAIQEVAVLKTGTGMEARLEAFVVGHEEDLTLLAIKRHCAQHLPRYMIVDRVHYLDKLPRTHNGKIDRHTLAEA